MSNQEIPIPTTAEASMTVTEADLACSLSTETRDTFPSVFATARMIALMELAAARCLWPLLGADGAERSVGVGFELAHSAPTPVGGQVTARATWLGREGKLHRFLVVAEDDAGEIGRGAHTRAIVQTERLLAGASKRAKAR